MALQAWGHSAYWSGPSTGGAGTSLGVGAYVNFGPQAWGWNDCITVGGGFGWLQPYWDRLVALGRLLWTCWRFPADQITAVDHLAVAMDARIYQTAQAAVRVTARTPSMRSHHQWHRIGQVAKARNWSENIYRRIAANDLADQWLRDQGSTATHMTRELAVELAYHAFKDRGR